MATFDYDIDHYSVRDLEDMIGLDYPYNKQHIDEKTQQLILMLKNDNLPNNELPKLNSFVTNIQLKLNSQLKPSSSNNIYNVNNDKFLINKPHDDELNLKNEHYSTGIVNPIKLKTIEKTVNIDTRFRKNYFNTDPANLNITLPFKVNKAISMILKDVQIPATYYPINAKHDNNHFIITIIKSDDAVFNLQVIIPDGHYTITQLVDYLNNTTFDAGNTGGYTIVAAYSSTTGKLTITASANSIAQLILDFSRPNGSTLAADKITWSNEPSNSVQLRLGWMLGFRVSQYTSNTSYTAEATMDIAGPKYIYVLIDDYQNNNHDNMLTAFADSFISKNILAKIPVYTDSGSRDPFSTIVWDIDNSPITSKRVYFGPVDIEKINISLLDDYGRSLNLNNRDWNLSVKFDTIYE